MLRALGLPAGLPMPEPQPRTEAETEALSEIEPVPAIPVYRPVDRAVPSALFTHDIPVIEPKTDTTKKDTILFAVRRAYDYPSGPFPAEPGRIPAGVDSRRAVCNNLSARAAARCLRGGGYF
jgi:hypothetical protein